jgi:hypothetical protein
VHFEKEAIHKKKILECDKENERLAFDLFGKELVVRKLMKNDEVDPREISDVRSEINTLRSHIDKNTQQKRNLQRKLDSLGKIRDEMLYNFRNEMEDSDHVDAMYNHHLLNLKNIEFARKEKQAEYHIKHRDMYIENLKAQLAMRDQIIREKLGASITNFLKQDMLTMQDLDGMSQEVLLPSLQMTSNKFDYNTDNEDYYKNREESDSFVDSNTNVRRRQRKYAGSSKIPYPLPNVRNETSLYQDQSKRNIKYIKNTKSKHSVSKRAGSISNSFDNQIRINKPFKQPISSLKKIADDNKNGFNYKPPLHGNNRGFAAQMLKNRNKYFSKNTRNNISVNRSALKDADKSPKNGATSSTAEVRSSHK